jgi:hypothetical protein
METFVHALCLFCATIGGAPQPQLQQSAGRIWFTHETLGRNAYLLRLSTSDTILDSDAAREGRLDGFARTFARKACRERFALSVAEPSSWPQTSPRYAKQYILHCR